MRLEIFNPYLAEPAGLFEQSSDGSSWETFWDVKAAKVP